MLKPLVIDHTSHAQNDAGTIPFPNSSNFLLVILVEMFDGDAEGNHPAFRPVLRKDLGAIDVVWAAHNNRCGFT